MEIQDLAEEYRIKTDEELLRLAAIAGDLTPEANLMLSNELSRRGINTAERLVPFREAEKKRQEEASKQTSLFIIHPFGIGHFRFGKADRVYNPASGLERFQTTTFIMLFWLPLIPTGTFVIERKRSFFSRRFTVLKRVPLDWRQVRRVWGVTLGVLLAIIVALAVLLYFS